MKKFIWILLSIVGASAFSVIALSRNETINAIWFIIASVCIYLIAYRFYAAWVATKVLVLDSNQQTPAIKFNDGKDFIPTDKWIVFGHHFAAIAGPGPLVGPTLAAQFGSPWNNMDFSRRCVGRGCSRYVCTFLLCSKKW